MMKCSNVLVSIIIPTLNSAKYIKLCLNGIEKQSYKHLEVIAIDGGSTDSTLNILNQYKKYLKIKIISSPGSNMGEARNIGLKRANGVFVTFCDSDDLYKKNKILHQVKWLLKNPAVDLVYTNALHREQNKKSCFLNRPAEKFSGHILSKICRRQFINLNTVLLRNKKNKSPVFPKGISGKYGEDWAFLINCALRKFTFAWLPFNDTIVSIRKGSHTTIERQFLMKLIALNNFKNNLDRFQEQGIPFNELVKVYLSRFVKTFLTSWFCGVSEISQSNKRYAKVFIKCKKEIYIIYAIRRLLHPFEKEISAFLLKLWIQKSKKMYIYPRLIKQVF